MEKLSLQSRRIFLIALSFLLCFHAAASASRNAGYAGAYLRPAAGASALGMGGAFSASPPYLISWYNPALLGALRESRASLGGAYRSMGRTEGSASLQFRVPPRLGAGLSLVYRGDPFLNDLYDGYYSQGTVIEEQPLERLSFSSATLKLGVGYYFSKSLLLGASIGIFHQSLPTTPVGDGLVENSSATSIGGFDFSAAYVFSTRWTVSAIIRNLGARTNWHIQSSDQWLDASIEEKLLPSLVLGSSLNTFFKDKPLMWNIDIVNYLLDGDMQRLMSPEAVINTGVQWQYWEKLALRAGIADIEINSGIYRDRSDYFRAFSPRLSAGFSWDMSAYKQGMRLNYALATDRIWAGPEQGLDLTIVF